MLAEVKNSLLVLSIRHDSPEYPEKVEPAIRLVRQWEQEHDFRAEIRPSDQEWMRLYRGSGSDMEPFDDGDPRTSWKNCVTRHCTQLFEGKLWRCPPLVYLKYEGLAIRPATRSSKRSWCGRPSPTAACARPRCTPSPWPTPCRARGSAHRSRACRRPKSRSRAA